MATRASRASDSFDRADGPVGANWLYIRLTSWQGNPPEVKSSEVSPRSGTGGDNFQVCRWAGSGTFAASQYASAPVGGLGYYGPNERGGVAVRCGTGIDTAATYYAAEVRDDGNPVRTVRVIRSVAGVITQLYSGTTNWVTGNVMALEVETVGSTVVLRLYRDGTLVTTVTDTDADRITTAGKPGLLIAGNTMRLASWESGDLEAEVGTPVGFTGTVPAQTGTVGTSYSLALSGYYSGTQTPFAYSLQAGTLPAGLSLNASTGVISGTPTTAGTSSGHVVRATDSASATANSNSFNIVISAAATGPTINTQPSAQSVTAPAGATFAVAATSSGGALSYQWQRNTGSGWSDISGAVSASYSTGATTVGMSGYQYRCVVTDSNGPRTSNAVSLTVTAVAPSASFTSSVIPNNAGSPQASVSVRWAWWPAGRVGAMGSIAPVEGTGTTSAAGRLTAPGLSPGAGVLLVTRWVTGPTDDEVFYEAGVAA